MLQLAESKWSIDKNNSFLIGDKKTDIECANNYGIRGHLFKNGNLLDFIKKSENF
jgi:D-glycero-D-manno-heptose 1,7-bisphosphate phosphatase